MTQYSLPPSLDAMLEEGALFQDKYRLLRFLGEGSFASVIHARHEAMDRDVALKFLRPDVVEAHPEASERFLTEVRVSSRLTSPHTVTIFDFGQTDEDIPFMVMEYVEGRPLDEAIDKYGALGLKRSIQMTMQILESLEEAHAHRIIHRDLKPANIMVGKAMYKKKKKGVHVKVLDFGVAKVVEQGDDKLDVDGGQGERSNRVQKPGRNRRSTQFIGTPRYMSPEQILGQEVSPASDLYSLGLVFYEMCTGLESITEQNVTKIAQVHLSEGPLRLKGLSKLPTVLTDIILRATARHRQDRYEDAVAFRTALEEAVEQGQKKHRKATTAATTAVDSERKDSEKERQDRGSNVFSGEGYVELPDEEMVGEQRSPTGGGSLRRPPRPGGSSAGRSPSSTAGQTGKTRKKTPKRDRRRASSSASSQSSGGLELDRETVESQQRDIARKRRATQRRQRADELKQRSTALWKWVVTVGGLILGTLVGFIIVGGALSMMAIPIRLMMALLPVLFGFLWAMFSDNPYPDTFRGLIVPWARRTGGLVVLAVLVLAVVMPAEAGHSLEHDALWFLGSLQEGWVATWVQGLCDAVAWGMRLTVRWIPWSSTA